MFLGYILVDSSSLDSGGGGGGGGVPEVSQNFSWFIITNVQRDGLLVGTWSRCSHKLVSTRTNVKIHDSSTTVFEIIWTQPPNTMTTFNAPTRSSLLSARLVYVVISFMPLRRSFLIFDDKLHSQNVGIQSLIRESFIDIYNRGGDDFPLSFRQKGLTSYQLKH